ncbi:hypothetical protein F6X51_03170 [Methylobacterium planeticum]|uniref:Porin n=1 Tax=Methylobacterium planeticum TaxID=2615211 RepID=A0A6N6MZF1_9HYPH|nr:hypothetical protein F6X51_03170 [Methylobacterium planeticum]
MSCVSAVLATGLAAGLTLAMPAAGKAPAIAATGVAATAAAASATAQPAAAPALPAEAGACRQAAWPYVPAACTAASGARPVRIIALGDPAQPVRVPGQR